MPSWERKEFRLELGVQPEPWLQSFLAKCHWASPSRPKAWFLHLQSEAWRAGPRYGSGLEKEEERKIVVL